MISREDVSMRDPFVVASADERMYYLIGSTCWATQYTHIDRAFHLFRSRDLQTFEGPFEVFHDPTFWGTCDYWAPEIHRHNGRFYIFASFKAADRCRAVHTLVADTIVGPYRPIVATPVTPMDWECLDGTLYFDRQNQPWMVFCHEWLQVHNGEMCAVRLSDDLSAAIDTPILLFQAHDAPWSANISSDPATGDYVTDGPFLHRDATGRLMMLWSSCGPAGYAMGIAFSETGEITGPWRHRPDPIIRNDGGHGMVFRTFDGQLMMTFHRPNMPKDAERPFFVPVRETLDERFLECV
jgi:beta-xylosidase